MADETPAPPNHTRWRDPTFWIKLVAGSTGAGITNYLAVAYAGASGKLALLSGILGACSYTVAYIQDPNRAPAIPAPPTPKKT
jgi:hypothetical protein